MSKKTRVLDALRGAGRRGLTRRELGDLVGDTYNFRLKELEDDGHTLNFVQGRYGKSWFRVTLVLEAQALAATEDDDVAMTLFEPPAAPPVNAALQDVAA